MTLSNFLQWVIDNKEYAPVYSVMIAMGSLLVSIVLFIISTTISVIHRKKDKKISDIRYEDQIRQYEERLAEERRRREIDKYEADERIRICERPYMIFKEYKDVSNQTSDNVIIRMGFINKGNGSAYELCPDTDCVAYNEKMEKIHFDRYYPIEDPIALVGERFITYFITDKKITDIIRMEIKIKFEDASGRKYKQVFYIDIKSSGSTTTISNGTPELCE